MPNKIENCIHGLDNRFCALCRRPVMASAPEGMPPRRGSRARQASNSQWLRHSFAGDERQLLLVPKLKEGWRFHKKTACFCERIVIYSMDARQLSAQVAMFPRPGISEPERAEDWFPRPYDAKGPSGGFRTVDGNVMPALEPIRYRIAGGELEISIDLIGVDDGFNPELDWRPNGSGKPQVHWQERDLLGADWVKTADPDGKLLVAEVLKSGELRAKLFVEELLQSADRTATLDVAAWLRSADFIELPPDATVRPMSRLQLQVLLIAEPRPSGSPISIEWCKRFFPGGLPSLGKRR